MQQNNKKIASNVLLSHTVAYNVLRGYRKKMFQTCGCEYSIADQKLYAHSHHYCHHPNACC